MKFWNKKGAKFEDFVAYVYQSLLELNDCASIVSKRSKIKGRDGAEGEIDVYYEFEHLNLIYRVAIECKDWNAPVTAKEVRDFYAKIENINNVAGVMISTSGYQSGAKEWAEARGIILMHIDDLPTFYQILAGRIEKVFLPNEKNMGEPFWTLMEIIDGKVAGSYIDLGGDAGIPLLISKKTAEYLRNKLPDKENWCVRGITQHQLRGLIKFVEAYGWKLSLCFVPIDKGEIQLISLDVDTIKKHYIL